ncbi:hypothetical protein [Brevundimonas lutea]|uniref:hypothetical protein n=1 Tax=Brevundimonas lutea TaxID=2293980 RepID=UPI000F013989|nr:hypothetical protein [Brevundimonas lutea]
MAKPVVHLYGLGNIGFRHLQGLAALSDEIRLVGVDPSSERCELARSEWKGEGRFVAEAEPEPAHIVILATSAQGRLALLRQVLDRHAPDHVLLEKVAFSAMDDFDGAQQSLTDAGAAGWVNCPRRQWPLHEALRERLQGVADWTMTQAGPNWGLACNGVHFIDLMQFLSGGGAPRAEGIAIDQIIPSKRSGYFEVEGQLTIGLGGRRLVVVQRPDAEPGLTIESTRGRWSVNEAAGVVTDVETGETLIDVGRSPYQSELTAAVVSPLLAGEKPPVASLAEARLAHAPLIEALTPIFEAAGHDVSGGLPIT